jgi:hypothetical protein
VALPTRSEQAFGDVEDEVGPIVEELRGKVLVGLETDDFAQSGERVLHGVDRCRVVPLDVEVGLRKVGAESPTGRLVSGRGVDRWSGTDRRDLRLYVESETDPNWQSDPLQKRPSARDEP